MDLGVFAILALSSTTTIGVVMAGWASNSKWSLYGAMREAAQVVAYEIPLGLSLLAPLFALGTFSLMGEHPLVPLGLLGSLIVAAGGFMAMYTMFVSMKEAKVQGEIKAAAMREERKRQRAARR